VDSQLLLLGLSADLSSPLVWSNLASNWVGVVGGWSNESRVEQSFSSTWFSQRAVRRTNCPVGRENFPKGPKGEAVPGTEAHFCLSFPVLPWAWVISDEPQVRREWALWPLLQQLLPSWAQFLGKGSRTGNGRRAGKEGAHRQFAPVLTPTLLAALHPRRDGPRAARSPASPDLSPLLRL
jgi:hypothetical protein